jgi:hypothetical protein
METAAEIVMFVALVVTLVSSVLVLVDRERWRRSPLPYVAVGSSAIGLIAIAYLAFG